MIFVAGISGALLLQALPSAALAGWMILFGIIALALTVYGRRTVFK